MSKFIVYVLYMYSVSVCVCCLIFIWVCIKSLVCLFSVWLLCVSVISVLNCVCMLSFCIPDKWVLAMCLLCGQCLCVWKICSCASLVLGVVNFWVVCFVASLCVFSTFMYLYILGVCVGYICELRESMYEVFWQNNMLNQFDWSISFFCCVGTLILKISVHCCFIRYFLRYQLPRGLLLTFFYYSDPRFVTYWTIVLDWLY